MRVRRYQRWQHQPTVTCRQLIFVRLIIKTRKGMAAAPADELKNLSMADGAAAPGASHLSAPGRATGRQAARQWIEPQSRSHSIELGLRERA